MAMNTVPTVLVALSLTCVGCATPSEVKQTLIACQPNLEMSSSSQSRNVRFM